MTNAPIPSLPRGVRRHFDQLRGVSVLLGPERVIMLDDIGCAILDEVDGISHVRTISETLASRYGAPKDAVLADVVEFLTDLADKKLLDFGHG